MSRFIYLDESGISAKEAITVVAGIVIDADAQWKNVEQYLRELIKEYVPVEHENFVFHAGDMLRAAASHARNHASRSRWTRRKAVEFRTGRRNDRSLLAQEKDF